MSERETSNQGKRPELKDALLPYYARYMRYCARIHDPASSSHPDNMKRTGNQLGTQRKALGLSREATAERMSDIEPRTEISSVTLMAFERGLIPSDDLRDDFMDRLHQVLSQPED